MTYPLVVIKWEDSVGFDGWVDLEEIQETKLSQHVAVGWLVQETDEALYITQSYDTVNNNFGAVQVIARSSVIHIDMPFVSLLAEVEKV